MTNSSDSDNMIIVKEFISAINRGDIEKITGLMHDGHRFIDSQNNETIGKENMTKAWVIYFDWFPDYRIEINRVFENDSTVALFGFAEGTYKIKKNEETGNHWRMPAAWLVEVENKKIRQWQVYSDSKPVFDIIGNNE